MTTLTRTKTIDAPAEAVWEVLVSLDEFAAWESGYVSSTYIGDQREGVGTLRKAVLKSPIGPRDVTHRVTKWQENELIAWEARDTNFPFLKTAEQTIRLRPEGGKTLVENRLDYELKYGLLGDLMDAMMMKRTVAGAAQGFLDCLAVRAAGD